MSFDVKLRFFGLMDKAHKSLLQSKILYLYILKFHILFNHLQVFDTLDTFHILRLVS